MKVIADAGPLMAFAKIDGLEILLEACPNIVSPPAVFSEAVTMGLSMGAADADSLKVLFDRGLIAVQKPRDLLLDIPNRLGLGEDECIRLAAELDADWLLLDDREARSTAEAVLESRGNKTKIRGTLGVIVSACVEGIVSVEEAIQWIRLIEIRSDIWIHPALCQKVISTLTHQTRSIQAPRPVIE